MRKFEAPELKISMFRKGNIITLSGEDTNKQTALEKAQTTAANLSASSVLSFSLTGE